MKKTIYLLVIIVISACSSSNRVCGGKGGKRCVEVTKNLNSSKIS